MNATLAADLVFLLHLAFILFVVCGGLFVRRWPRLAFLHLPAVVWGAAVECFAWTCPLTPLEDHLRRLAGEPGLATGFLAHHLAPLIYPGWLSREVQIALGIGLLLLNAVCYGWAFHPGRRGGRP